jgi:hypothetical protein
MLGTVSRDDEIEMYFVTIFAEQRVTDSLDIGERNSRNMQQSFRNRRKAKI